MRIKWIIAIHTTWCSLGKKGGIENTKKVIWMEGLLKILALYPLGVWSDVVLHGLLHTCFGRSSCVPFRKPDQLHSWSPSLLLSSVYLWNDSLHEQLPVCQKASTQRLIIQEFQWSITPFGIDIFPSPHLMCNAWIYATKLWFIAQRCGDSEQKLCLCAMFT